MDELKTTVIVSTYPGDKYRETIEKYLDYIQLGKKKFEVLFCSDDVKHTFAENNNIGAKLAKTPYIVFLNSDTEPQPDFIEQMEKSIESHKQYGVIGVKLYFLQSFVKKVDFKGKQIVLEGHLGDIQHAGINYNNRLLPEEIGWGHSSKDPKFNESRLVPSVTGACMMVRREEFLALGGFDENFKNGWEDTDLCLRYAESGKLCYYNANARVGHQFAGSQYSGRFDNEDANYDYWIKKWHKSGRIFPIFYGIPSNVKNLDIGCGENKKEGYFGIDKFPGKSVDLIFNLEEVGIEEKTMPFGDSTIENIYCSHTLEHLENTLEIMNDFHRVLKTDGWLEIIVPHAFSWSAWASPFHKKYFVPETFREYFASDKHAEKSKTELQMGLIKPWHIEKLDFTLAPVGINPFEIEREIVVRMRPLK